MNQAVEAGRTLRAIRPNMAEVAGLAVIVYKLAVRRAVTVCMLAVEEVVVARAVAAQDGLEALVVVMPSIALAAGVLGVLPVALLAVLLEQQGLLAPMAQEMEEAVVVVVHQEGLAEPGEMAGLPLVLVVAVVAVVPATIELLGLVELVQGGRFAYGHTRRLRLERGLNAT